MKKFHDAPKTIYCPKSSEATTLLLKRWAEHFNSVLNRPSTINEDAIDRRPQIECNVLLDEFPTVMGSTTHLAKLQVQMQFLQRFIRLGATYSRKKLTELFHCMWRKEAIPQEFKVASIIHLYKRKGNPQVCDNHRGTSLLSIAGKILAKFC